MEDWRSLECALCGEQSTLRLKEDPTITFCSPEHHAEWKEVGASFWKTKKGKKLEKAKTVAARELEQVLVDHIHNVQKVMTGVWMDPGASRDNYLAAAQKRVNLDPSVIGRTLKDILSQFNKSSTKVDALQSFLERKNKKTYSYFEAVAKDKETGGARGAAERRRDSKAEEIVDDIFNFEINYEIGLDLSMSRSTEKEGTSLDLWMANVLAEAIEKIFPSSETQMKLAVPLKAISVHTRHGMIKLASGDADASFKHMDEAVFQMRRLSGMIIDGLAQ